MHKHKIKELTRNQQGTNTNEHKTHKQKEKRTRGMLNI